MTPLAGRSRPQGKGRPSRRFGMGFKPRPEFATERGRS